MADTKQLLESQDLDPIVRYIQLVKDSFTNEQGQKIDYNYLLVTLENDDTLRFKVSPTDKASIFFAKKELSTEK